MRRASSRICARSASGGSQVVPRPPYTKRRSAPRRIASSTGRSTAVPSGSTIPWMLHGTPSRNGITRTRSQRGPKNVEGRAGVVVGQHPAHEVPAAVEAVAGVPGPHHALPLVERATGLAQPGLVAERHDPRRCARAADRVPDLVGDQLVLQGGPRAGTAADHRAPVDRGGADERADQPDRLAAPGRRRPPRVVRRPAARAPRRPGGAGPRSSSAGPRPPAGRRRPAPRWGSLPRPARWRPAAAAGRRPARAARPGRRSRPAARGRRRRPGRGAARRGGRATRCARRRRTGPWARG